MFENESKDKGGLRNDLNVNSSTKNLETDIPCGFTRNATDKSFVLNSARDKKVITNMYNTAANFSPERKNKWLTDTTAREKTSRQPEELANILSYNSPLSPIRPYPTALNGINQHLVSSKRIFPIDNDLLLERRQNTVKMRSPFPIRDFKHKRSSVDPIAVRQRLHEKF